MLLQDVRYALRSMRRAPFFTIVIVLTLAIGIGANSAMFSLADALILRPLPVERPEDLRALFQVMRIGGRALKSGNTLPNRLYEDLRDHADAFSGMAAFAELDDISIEVGERREVRARSAAFVTDNYFSVLGVTPRLGRPFAAGEALPASADRVVILSDRFWRRELGGTGDVLGTTIRVAGTAFTVIGVTAPEFFGVVLGRSPDLYLPLGSYALAQPGIVTAENPDFWSVRAIGRMARAVSNQTAADRLTTVLQATLPADPKPVIELLPIDTGFSDVRARFLRPIQALMLLVVILLLIACTNVAVMLLSRGVTRRSEIAVRLAMGAGGRRVVQQLITEGLVFAALAAGVGLAVTPWVTQALVALLPTGDTPMALHVAIDTRVVVFTAGISIAAAVLFAAIPAVRAMRMDATATLVTRDRGATPARAAIASFLIVAQIAMSLAILSGAGLLVRTLYGLSTRDAGFDSDHVVLLDVTPASRGYLDARRTAYYQNLLERITSIPGVQSATMAQIGFLERLNRTTGAITSPGSPSLTDDERQVQVFMVGPRFFETLGVPIVNGHDFTAADMAGPRVAAINLTAARRFFAGANPVGSAINNAVQVLAVVGDSTYHELRDTSVPAMFIPYTQSRVRERMVFSVRGASGDIAAAVLREASSLDPQVPMRVTPLREVWERSLSQERLLAVLSGFFAAAALSLLAIGLFGQVMFRVRQRTTEIGVRLALGAKSDQVVWLVLQQPIKLALIGVAIGVPATLAVTRLMTSLLFGLMPGDVPTLAGSIAGVLVIVAASASWPAWRASRVDPATALREVR